VRLEDPDGSADSPIALLIDESGLTNAVRSAVDDHCFARASLLEPPTHVPAEEFQGWDVARRDAHWLEQAHEIGADLILECAKSAVMESRPFLAPPLTSAAPFSRSNQSVGPTSTPGAPPPPPGGGS
jgi:hypothetical protein